MTTYPRPADDGLDAFAAMLAFDDDNPLERSSRAMDEILSGTIRIHKVRRED